MIVDNTSVRGGGIYCKLCRPIVRNCIIARNVATSDDGGGVYGGARLNGCTVAFNLAKHSGGVGNYEEFYPHVASCIVWGNEPDQLTSKCTAIYSDVRGGFAGVGNIDTDPCFADPNHGDYHLSAGSPCIDAGEPAYTPERGETDCDHEKRIWNSERAPDQARLDMGADEYGSFAYGDLDCSGGVDFFDINPFVLALTEPGAYSAIYPHCEVQLGDLNADGRVDSWDINPFVLILTTPPG